HSELYQILSVIDSKLAGRDTGQVLDGAPNGVPLVADLDDAIRVAGAIPEFLIFGMAPASGLLSLVERGVMLDAMSRGINIVNGLHEFMNDDVEFAAASAAYGVF